MSYDVTPYLKYLHPLWFFTVEELAEMLPKEGNPVECAVRLRAKLRRRAEDFPDHQAHIMIGDQPAFTGFLWASSTWEATKEAPPVYRTYTSLEIGHTLPMLAPKLELLPPVMVPPQNFNVFVGGVAMWNPTPPKAHKMRLHIRRSRKERIIWGIVK